MVNYIRLAWKFAFTLGPYKTCNPMVMWEPVILAPLKGCEGPNSVLQDMRPGILTSASSISRRPKSAWDISFTLYSQPLVVFSMNKAMVRMRVSWELDLMKFGGGREWDMRYWRCKCGGINRLRVYEMDGVDWF